jgi:hypothetical protein
MFLASQKVRATVPDRVPEAGKIDHYCPADVFVELGKQGGWLHLSRGKWLVEYLWWGAAWMAAARRC